MNGAGVEVRVRVERHGLQLKFGVERHMWSCPVSRAPS